MKRLLLVAFITFLLSLVAMYSKQSTANAVQESHKTETAHTPTSESPLLNPSTTKKVEITFESKSNSILLELPTQRVIEDRPGDDFHLPPGELLIAAKSLAYVLDKMKENPANIPTGKDFFDRCARRESVLEQVRALCLRNLQDWAIATKDPVSLESYPERIIKLSQFLPVSKVN